MQLKSLKKLHICWRAIIGYTKTQSRYKFQFVIRVLTNSNQRTGLFEHMAIISAVGGEMYGSTKSWGFDSGPDIIRSVPEVTLCYVATTVNSS
jgi:hypothetical protein